MTTIVKCPVCKKEVVWNQNNRYRPFCSERCKTNDLSAWASGNYIIHEFESNDSPSSNVNQEDDEITFSNVH